MNLAFREQLSINITTGLKLFKNRVFNKGGHCKMFANFTSSYRYE